MQHEQSESSNRECLCDKIWGRDAESCDCSTAYLCEMRAAHSRPPNCYFNGRKIDALAAVETAAKILADAKAPLITGLGGLGIRAQKAALAVGQKVGAVIDTGGGLSRSVSLALPREGWVSATVGEFERRADLILVWDCDPLVTQPRLWQRLSAGREVVVFASSKNETAQSATAFYQIEGQRMTATLMMLEAMTRALPQMKKITDQFEWEVGFSQEAAEQFLAKLKHHSWMGVVTEQPVGEELGEFDSTQDSLVSWIKSLQPFLRAAQLDIRNDKNNIAAENVMTWTTGFCNGVDSGGTVPQSYGCEYASEHVLVRNEIDAVLGFDFGGEGERSWNREMAEYLDPLPQIVFSSYGPSEVKVRENVSHLLLTDFNVLDDDFARLDDLLFNANELCGTIDESEKLDPGRDASAFLRELTHKLS